MGWPASQDYNEAIQTPTLSFGDPELKSAQVVTNALGLPVPRSGNFADVYEIRCPASGRTWAVKCFTRHIPRLRERYREISQHLRSVRLPFTVDFQYVEEGIRIRGSWYPVLKMAWVEGVTINEFVRRVSDQPAVLYAVAQMWVRMAKELDKAHLAHCDLQHGNVILVPRRTRPGAYKLQLIDYDGMWVPRLCGQPSGECGHPAYQHPQRIRESTYTPDADHFSHLVIVTALHCVAKGGRRIWDLYDNGDNLLFRQQDFTKPEQSQLFCNLWDTPEPISQALVGKLILASKGPLGSVPPVYEVLDSRGIAALTDAESSELAAMMQFNHRKPFDGCAQVTSNVSQATVVNGVTTEDHGWPGYVPASLAFVQPAEDREVPVAKSNDTLGLDEPGWPGYVDASIGSSELENNDEEVRSEGRHPMHALRSLCWQFRWKLIIGFGLLMVSGLTYRYCIAVLSTRSVASPLPQDIPQVPLKKPSEPASPSAAVADRSWQDVFDTAGLDPRRWRVGRDSVSIKSEDDDVRYVRLSNGGSLVSAQEYRSGISLWFFWRWHNIAAEQDHLAVALRTSGTGSGRRPYEIDDGIVIKFDPKDAASITVTDATQMRGSTSKIPMPSSKWYKIGVVDQRNKLYVSFSERNEERMVLTCDIPAKFSQFYFALYNRDKEGSSTQSDIARLNVISYGARK